MTFSLLSLRGWERVVIENSRRLGAGGDAKQQRASSQSARCGRELLQHYRDLESGVRFEDTGAYRELVVPNGNSKQPIHRWFRFKEGFSSSLLRRVLADAGWHEGSPLSVVDPFVGSGTTVAAAAQLVADGSRSAVNVVGYECNPFLHLVAQSKLDAFREPSRTFRNLARSLANSARRREHASRPPALSAFNNGKFFSASDLDELMKIRDAIKAAAEDGASLIDLNLARVCLGTIVEPVSKLRRDGRALRYVPDKRTTDPLSAFSHRAALIAEDLERIGVPVNGRVELGDGRTLRPEPPTDDSIDLALFSPPYPNNIDYTEVYKLESWLLGFITSDEAFREQRLKTLYSHPSLLRGVDAMGRRELRKRLLPLLAPLLAVIPEDRYATGRTRMIWGYFRDIYVTLESAYRVLRPGATLVYVVGNSLHGGLHRRFIIAADVLIAHVARLCGFDPQRIEVARALGRRGHEAAFLRESVVFLRKPLV